MGKTTGHILKAGDVKLEGQLYLDLTNAQGSLPKAKNVALPSPQAHIVQNQQEFVVIEVMCCCGKKTYLKCEYGGPETSV